MRKVKILGVLTHFKLKKDKEGKEVRFVSAVDYYRIIQPLLNLPKDQFEVDIDHNVVGKHKTLEETTKYYDIIYSSYIDTAEFYARLKVNCLHNNCDWVIDLDDNVWHVSPTHPYYEEEYKPGCPSITKRVAILKDTTYLTTTNSFLRYQMMESLGKNIKAIQIFPNYINLTDFDFNKIPSKEGKDIQIGYCGGSSHFDDINKPEFTKAIQIIMDKYPNVTLKTTFYMPQLKALFGYKYKYSLGRFSMDSYIKELWPQMLGSSDIMVAPLSWSKYSRAKSYIKYLEMGAGKKPMVCERIDPYNEILNNHEERGFLASTTEEWVKYLSMLIESPELRKKVGEEAYKYVKENHTIQENVDPYAKYFKRIVHG
jgi:glycosyltransferase involved in cell wall biosynthesis